MDSFEARLGPRAWQPADEEKVDAGAGSLVLVVLDVNKELTTSALDWALSCVVQRGDTVKVLGILHHIMTPMGYKSRADENIWNGSSRKILDNECAMKKMMLQSIPHMVSKCEKLGVKLEIDVKAHIAPKKVVVEEAKNLKARYVVIDRNMKKDKKYYIDNLTCFVTRVRTINDYEHLRHGLPMNDTDIKSEHGFISVNGCISATETSVQHPSLASSLETQAQASVHADWAQVQAHTNIPLTAEHQSILNGKFSKREFLKLNHKSGNVSGKLPHQPELRMGTGYRYEMSNVQDLAVTNWLSQGGGGADSAHFNESSKQCYSGTGHIREEMENMSGSTRSPTEESLADQASSFFHPSPYAELPPHPLRKQSAEWLPMSGPSTILSSSFPPASLPHSPDSVLSELRPCGSINLASDYSAELPSSHPGMLNASIAALEALMDMKISRGKDRGHPGPISVQPRRVDASWAFDLLDTNPEDRQVQPTPSSLQHFAAEREGEAVMRQKGKQNHSAKKSPVEERTEMKVLPQKDVNPSNSHDPVKQTSSVKRAVSSKKQSPGTPPLCSVCHQKSPEFGKVKRFQFIDLQEATNNFSAENYLAEGAYGLVYKGRLKDGQLVAVKQHRLPSSQGDQEFCSEVEVLSCAQHRNLVTLIGYCVENHLRLLVYEYVCNGSLDQYLSSKNKEGLQWKHRYYIALGAGKALRYLHEECRVGCIVHRDMRPNNILLTHDFIPMVGDFGLARRQSSREKAEETQVIGTMGYLAPEYAETGQITDKADVYAFGVVLLELITGRKAINYNCNREQVSLTDWAQPLLDNYAKELVDPRLKLSYDDYEMHCMMHAANQCIKKDPAMRPRMTQNCDINSRCRFCKMVARNFGQIILPINYTHCQEMMKSVGSHGSSSLLFVMKVLRILDPSQEKRGPLGSAQNYSSSINPSNTALPSNPESLPELTSS